MSLGFQSLAEDGAMARIPKLLAILGSFYILRLIAV
jgi:hypothetical protein